MVQFNSQEQEKDFLPIYEKILKYIGKIEVIIQITYKKIDQPENNLFGLSSIPGINDA